MATEIERKFLVTDVAVISGLSGQHIVQGYLSNGPTSVRIRVARDDGIARNGAWLTIKGPTAHGARAEYEYTIPRADAAELLRLCRWPPIEKTRYRLRHAGHVWEIDVFHGANAPLVVAEVELARVDEPVVIPAWARPEVTDDARYSNAWLTEHPYSAWVKQP